MNYLYLFLNLLKKEENKICYNNILYKRNVRYKMDNFQLIIGSLPGLKIIIEIASKSMTWLFCSAKHSIYQFVTINTSCT